MSLSGMPGFDGKKDIDFAPGYVTGIRSWDFGVTGGLIGAYGGTWRPGENMARCASGFDHDVPHEACGCGFWAYWADDLYARMSIAGVIKGYGHTVIGPRGFRCAKAEILALSRIGDRIESLDDSMYKRASKEFGVTLYPSVEEMLADHPLTTEYYEPDWQSPVNGWNNITVTSGSTGGGFSSIVIGGGVSAGLYTFPVSVSGGNGGWYSISGGVSGQISFAGGGMVAGGGGSGGVGGSSAGGNSGISFTASNWEE